MQRRHTTLGLAALLTTGLLAGLAPHAQARDEDDGEYVILHARYGTEERNVNVTDRLRELARQDRRFRLTNELFGVDPDPGRTKTLRLYARDRQGREHHFDFRERDWLDGAQFIGWGSGRWGEPQWSHGWQGSERHREQRQDDGQFTILRASYGTGRREFDVTERLRELARRDVRVRLTNDLFDGMDPDPGRTKRLRIIASDRYGQEQAFEYPEYTTVDGAQFIGWGGGEWGPARAAPMGRLVIESASYGADGRWTDVTQIVRSQLRGDRLEAEVRNELFGFDPAPGRRKMLRVTFRRGHEPSNTVQVGERDTLRLP